MQKIAFFLNNHSMLNIDYSGILEGNPGVAGSEYEFLLIPYLLEIRDNDIDPYLCVNFSGNFPHKNVEYTNDLKEACDFCMKEGINQIVVDIKYFNHNILKNYENRLSVLIWAHNNVSYNLLKLFSRLTYIKRIINCGREEMELYRDNIATLKSTYIYNIFPFKSLSYYKKRMLSKDNHNVVFMGSITKEKGFHILARAWKKVLAKVPDAELFVVGSGRLYNSKARLGKYNIAEEKYEEMFMPYLVDSKEQILPSVHFLGLLGDEKYDILGNCKVAVPNPTGFSECLPITSIEMQLMGCSITTINHSAYLDTVFNQDFLFSSESKLSKYLIKRLTTKADDYQLLYNFVTKKFGIDGNIDRWEYVIKSNSQILEPISNNHNQLKSLKDFLLKAKIKYSFLNILPPIELFYWYPMLIKRKYYEILFKFKL